MDMTIIRSVNKFLQTLLRGKDPEKFLHPTQERPLIDLFFRTTPCDGDDAELEQSLRSQSVMVTGAGGSIGSALCRRIIKCQPRRLVLIERSEFALYSIEKDLRKIAQANPKIGDLEIIAHLADCGDRPRMTSIMRERHIDVVYHAAAFKHVPIVEGNEIEGIRNNSFATWRSALSAMDADVSLFVLVSTDKAVRPVGMMGATKRLAEIIVQSLALETTRRENATRFAIVRFGNVIGSSGSVLPLFEEQIAEGGPITITHPEVTRYFMTIPEAAKLVMQAGIMAEESPCERPTGEIFVLDMGEPISILTLAEHLVRQAGLKVGRGRKEIEIIFSGLRPGEKLHEELTQGERLIATTHPSIRRCFSERMPRSELEPRLHGLEAATDRHDVREARRLVESFMADYQSSSASERSLQGHGH
jgi:FlaA1/EpsC-like NDP-sugar epimerase